MSEEPLSTPHKSGISDREAYDNNQRNSADNHDRAKVRVVRFRINLVTGVRAERFLHGSFVLHFCMPPMRPEGRVSMLLSLGSAAPVVRTTEQQT